MKQYETTFIIDGTLSKNDRDVLLERCETSLKDLGGVVERVVRWGMRHLAFTIKKRTHGYYVIFYYKAESSVIAAFERMLSLNEQILRYMTLVSDGKQPDYIRDEDASIPDAKQPDGYQPKIYDIEEEKDVEQELVDGELLDEEIDGEGLGYSGDEDDESIGDNDKEISVDENDDETSHNEEEEK